MVTDRLGGPEWRDSRRKEEGQTEKQASHDKGFEAADSACPTKSSCGIAPRISTGPPPPEGVITVFGTPVDITLSELAIETLFPADEETGAVPRSLSLN